MIVGLSANPDRPSHWIARYLQEHGYKIIGVNPGLPKVPEIKVVARLEEVPEPLEIVNVYRSPEAIPGIVDELSRRQPALIWLQPGAQNPAAEKRAAELGLRIVSGPCIYQEHRHLLG